MENMLLHLKEIDFSSDHSTGGIIYITIGDVCFPDEQWYDLITVDFDQWLPKLISFARKHTNSCLLSFMDGPCCVKLVRAESGSVAAACLWEQKILIQETEIDFTVFLESVVKAVRKYRRISHEETGQTPYGEELSIFREMLC